MRNLMLALVALAGLFGICGPRNVTAANEIQVSYLVSGEPDWLVIAGAEGMPFWARDTSGRTVAQGVVQSSRFALAIQGAAPGSLLVGVGGQVQSVAPDAGEGWLWE